MIRWIKEKLASRKSMKSTIIVNKKTSPLDVDLVDKDASKEDKKEVRQYTKKLVTALTIMSCIWISVSYILAAINLIWYQSSEYLSELSQQVCITIVGVVVSYCIKAYLESYSAAKHDEDMKKLELGQEVITVPHYKQDNVEDTVG